MLASQLGLRQPYAEVLRKLLQIPNLRAKILDCCTNFAQF
jgi:hypothetical protein